MNGLRASLAEIATIRATIMSGPAGRAEIVICPPATLLMAAAEICEGTSILLGGQDCHPDQSGAFTGDISAEMLKDAGAVYVIVGHSERRTGHLETNETVRIKASAALRGGLVPIICVGETGPEREAGEAHAIVQAQLAGSIPVEACPGSIVIAYEPVWAIGSGLTPTPKDIASMHRLIRTELDARRRGQGSETRILYGGSVKPANAPELMGIENVDGALVGGASLVAADFLAIAAAYSESAL